MNQVKILHCADMHLGADLSVLGRKSTTRKAEMKKTFMNVVKMCQDEQIKMLLISGDLFDNVHIQESLVEDIRDGFASLTDTIVAIAPGNHDPLTEDSPYMKKDFWPHHVIIFGNELKSVEFEGLGVRLWGAAFKGTYATNSILQQVLVPNDSYINICVIHGDMVSHNQKSSYNPITEAQLSRSGMDYVALGHIHQRSEILKAGDTFYAYPGCPEGGGFDELDDKGVYIGFVAKHMCSLTYRKICQRMNVELKVDISEAVHSKAAADIILEKMKSKYEKSYMENLYKIILEGNIPDHIHIDMEEIRAAFSDVFFVKIKDRTVVDIDMETVAGDTTLKGIFVRKMMEQMSDLEDKKKEKFHNALKLGLKAFTGEVKYSED